jgi:non-heme chloroperoxidase
MNRRQILKSAGGAAVAAAVAAPVAADHVPSQAAAAPPAARGDLRVRTRDGQELAVQDWGSGPPILFLAAWGLPSEMWAYQMVPLSEQGFRTVAYDRRGHGRSSRPGTGYDADTLADDLAAVLDALDLRDVTLVGMSIAGGEMVRYVTRHGTARLARLVFVGTAATPFPTQTADNPAGVPAERFEMFRQQMLLRDYPKWLEDNRPAFFVPETSAQIQDWVKAMMLDTSLKALVECNRTFTSTDFRAELPKVALPALVIHGDADVSAPLDLTGRPTAKLLPNARLTVYEGAPHGLFVTHRDRLTADLLAFARG